MLQMMKNMKKKCKEFKRIKDELRAKLQEK